MSTSSAEIPRFHAISVILLWVSCVAFTGSASLSNPQLDSNPSDTIYVQDGFGYSGFVKSVRNNSAHASTGNTSAVIFRYDTWPGGLASVGYAGFHGGIFDGISIWLFPFDADAVMRVFVDNKTIVAYRQWPTDGFVKQQGAFTTGVFDGESIWLIPYHADRVVRLFTGNGSMMSYNNWPFGFALVPAAFSGAAFDGISIWMAPSNADRVIRLFCGNGSMVGYANWPVGFSKRQSAFTGAYYDGSLLWMLPSSADVIVTLNVSDGRMRNYSSPAGGFSFGQSQFVGGVADGQQSIWLVPFNADRVVRVMTNNASMSEYLGWPANFSKLLGAFGGGTFDGCSVWFAPSNVPQTVRIFTGNGSMESYGVWPAGYTATAHAFRGAIFDGSSIWFVPHTSKTLIELRVPAAAACHPTNGVKTGTKTGQPSSTLTHDVTDTQAAGLTGTATASRRAFSQTLSIGTSVTASRGFGRPKSSSRTSSASTTKKHHANLFETVSISATFAQLVNTSNASRIPIDPLTQILGVAGARIVARSSVAAAVLGSSLSPTMAVQAARPFVFLRSVNCKYRSESDTPESDDPDSVELPLQVPLGSGAFSLYAGSMVVSLAAFVGVPTLALAVLHFLIVRSHRLPPWVLLLQRKVVSTAFFMTVGYFLPPTLKVFVLAAAHNGSTVAVLGASLCLAVALAILAFLVEVIVRAVPKVDGLWPLILSPTVVPPNQPDLHVAPAEKVAGDINCRSILASVESRHFLGTFGPLFCDARSLERLPIRVYFLEDLSKLHLAGAGWCPAIHR